MYTGLLKICEKHVTPHKVCLSLSGLVQAVSSLAGKQASYQILHKPRSEGG